MEKINNNNNTFKKQHCTDDKAISYKKDIAEMVPLISNQDESFLKTIRTLIKRHIEKESV